MLITVKLLKEKKACTEGVTWLKKHGEQELIPLLEYVIKSKDKELLDWANWLIVRCMTYKQYVSYAVFAAEQAIDKFEKGYPNDNRPRKAIEAAKKCIVDPSDKNKEAATTAAYAASYTASYTADSASYAAYAAYAASYASYAAYSSSSSSAAAAAAADTAAADASTLRIKILKHGILLLKGEQR